jgi:3-deoxy-D-manno-octulosonic-acid transferase
MYAFYNITLLLASPFLLGLFLFRLVADRTYRAGVMERFGFVKDVRRKAGGFQSSTPYPIPHTPRRPPVIWFHAVSVGEVMAAEPLVRAVRAAYPGATLLLSTVTVTGQATARQRLPEIDRLFYFPYDLPGVVQRAIRRLSPTLFIFLETELWPNFLRALSRRKIPSLLVNGRISPRSYRRYRRIRPLAKEVLSNVSLFLVQTDRDLQYLTDLGADPKKVIRTGNQKYDQAAGLDRSDPAGLRLRLGLSAGEKLLIAGSTHEGEEEMLLSAYRNLISSAPEVVLLLAPRHLNRLAAVDAAVRKAGLTPIRKSELAEGVEAKGWRGEASNLKPGTSSGSLPPISRVILLDTLGELGGLYAAANLVFIGGSLVPVGGHNLLEAAAHGKVVFFGPHMENFAEVARQALAEGCGVQVKDPEDLSAALLGWLRSPERLSEGGARAKEWVASHRGSVKMNLEWIRRFISSEDRPSEVG